MHLFLIDKYNLKWKILPRLRSVTIFTEHLTVLGSSSPTRVPRNDMICFHLLKLEVEHTRMTYPLLSLVGFSLLFVDKSTNLEKSLISTEDILIDSWFFRDILITSRSLLDLFTSQIAYQSTLFILEIILTKYALFHIRHIYRSISFWEGEKYNKASISSLHRTRKTRSQ